MKSSSLIIFFLICWSIPGVSGANVHGMVFAWSDFDKPLHNAIIEVNSTPIQYKIATDGSYSFDLQPGNYLITAKYYNKNILEYLAEEELRIDTEGNFTVDLLLFPPTESEYGFLVDINLTDEDINFSEIEPNNENDLLYVVSVLLLFSIGFIIFYQFKKKKTKSNETVHSEIRSIKRVDEVDMPEDLAELLDILKQMGGRATQRDLRKKISFSEAKVSLMITDLEDRGLVKKIKKGRANIIILHEK